MWPILLGLIVCYICGIATSTLVNYKKIKRYNAPPSLESADDIVNYLEASAACNSEVQNLLSDFQNYANQKRLPSSSTVTMKKPNWYHDTSANASPEEHWNLFLDDINLESEAANKIKVIKSWLDLNNIFTYKERNLMIAFFENDKDRDTVRKMLVKYTDKHRTQKTSATRPTSTPTPGAE